VLDSVSNKNMVQYSIGTGEIEGGIEQLLMESIPKLIVDPNVTKLSVQRSENCLPMLQVLMELENDDSNHYTDFFEDVISDNLKSDDRLDMSPLVAVSSEQNKELQDSPYGVRSQKIDASELTVLSDDWWQAEQKTIELVASLLKEELNEVLDRKSIAPTLLYLILKQNSQSQQIGVESFQLAQQLLEITNDPSFYMNKLRRNINVLQKKDIAFISDLPSGYLFESKLLELSQLITNLHIEKNNQNVMKNTWLSITNKLGFTVIDAAYFALMVSVEAKAKES